MLQHIFGLFNVLFGATVDGIIGDITGKVRKLRAVQQRLAAEATRHREAAFFARAKAVASDFEAGRASVIAEKLSALVA
jgi:hypothetical protein